MVRVGARLKVPYPNVGRRIGVCRNHEVDRAGLVTDIKTMITELNPVSGPSRAGGGAGGPR